jgi:hypothetical protein
MLRFLTVFFIVTNILHCIGEFFETIAGSRYAHLQRMDMYCCSAPGGSFHVYTNDYNPRSYIHYVTAYGEEL